MPEEKVRKEDLVDVGDADEKSTEIDLDKKGDVDAETDSKDDNKSDDSSEKSGEQ